MRKLLVILLAAMTMLALPSSVLAETKENISDMPGGWSKDAVSAAVDNGLLQGYNGAVDPQGLLTRAQLAAILVRAFGLKDAAPNLSAYADAVSSAWYYAELSAAVSYGLFQGDGGNIRPNDPITREEVAVVLARAFALKGDGASLTGHADIADIGSWAANAVAALEKAGYMKGYADTTLKPKGQITREEFASLMFRIVKLYITAPGDYPGLNVDGFVVARVPDVTISGTIAGSVVLTQPGSYKLDIQGAALLMSSGITMAASKISGGVTITKTGSYTLEVEGNITVATPDVTLRDSKITGDILLGDGVAESDVTRTGTTVSGTIRPDGSITETAPPLAITPDTGAGGGGGNTIFPPSTPATSHVVTVTSAAAALAKPSGETWEDPSVLGSSYFYTAVQSVITENLNHNSFKTLVSLAGFSFADGASGKASASNPAARNAEALLSAVTGTTVLRYSDGAYAIDATVTVSPAATGYYRVAVDSFNATITTSNATSGSAISGQANLRTAVHSALQNGSLDGSVGTVNAAALADAVDAWMAAGALGAETVYSRRGTAFTLAGEHLGANVTLGITVS